MVSPMSRQEAPSFKSGRFTDIKGGVKAGFDNEGNIVVKNRAWRRKFKNRAQLERKKSKKFYTKKKRSKR